MSHQMSRHQFQQWAEAQPRGRFERVDGEVVAKAPERWVHARLRAQTWLALDRAITLAGLACEAVPRGMTVEIDDDTDCEPDALVNCGPPIPDDAIAAPNPVVIVEVLSPGTAPVDTGAKLADYFRLASVQHYLLVRPTRREIVHHRRVADGILTQIVHRARSCWIHPEFALHSMKFTRPDARDHPTCSIVVTSPANVVRRTSRTSLRSNRRARCIVVRLSQITRSLSRHSCE
jgi:Uma2 family endonuclease